MKTLEKKLFSSVKIKIWFYIAKKLKLSYHCSSSILEEIFRIACPFIFTTTFK